MMRQRSFNSFLCGAPVYQRVNLTLPWEQFVYKYVLHSYDENVVQIVI